MLVMLFIPRSLVRTLRRYWTQSLIDRLWQLFVIVVALFLIILGSRNYGILAALALGVLFSAIFADDVRQLWSDIWNRNFWMWRS